VVLVYPQQFSSVRRTLTIPFSSYANALLPSRDHAFSIHHNLLWAAGSPPFTM
jgi:hypothetical protein